MDVAADQAAGNGNIVSNQLSIDYDDTAPTMNIATTSANPTNDNPIPATVTFSDPVTEFESSDLTVAGATVANFTGSGTDYSLDLIPLSDGELTVMVPGTNFCMRIDNIIPAWLGTPR